MRLSDGGHVCLDWCNEKDTVEESCAIVFLPGLSGQHIINIKCMTAVCTYSGSSEEKYITHFLHDMTECNYR